VSANRVEFGDLPPDPVRLVWCDWLRRHGIDPNEVAAPGWIERRPDTFQIVYEAYVLGDKGMPVWDPRTRGAIRTVRVFQMEGPPLPFPTEDDHL
jgi:hypothetical protein